MAVILCAAIVGAAGYAAVRFYRPKTAAAAAVSSTGVTKNTGSKSSASSGLQPSSKQTAVSAKPVKKTNRIVVLMYHSINREKRVNILRVPHEKFAAEMKWLYDNGYHTLSLDELYAAAMGSKKVPEKSIVLTFDDGYRDNYQSAFPILKKYHFKATVFMITGEINDTKNGYLTADELKEMDANGFAVESHTVTHPDLSTLSYKRQYRELYNSKVTLEKLLGHPVLDFAYPSGEYNSKTLAAAKKIGYRFCFKENGGMAYLSDPVITFPRAFVGENLTDFIARVKGTAHYSK